MKLLTTLLAFILLTHNIVSGSFKASTIGSVADGDYNVAANWNTGVVPALTDDVDVKHNMTIASGQTGDSHSITIADGKSLTIVNGGTLKVKTYPHIGTGSTLAIEGTLQFY
jgi:hypothetical protein